LQLKSERKRDCLKIYLQIKKGKRLDKGPSFVLNRRRLFVYGRTGQGIHVNITLELWLFFLPLFFLVFILDRTLSF
jgi:hypothetical protein